MIREVIPRTITTLSVPFSRFGRIKIGGRGTIVRLQNGSLAVFSPVALTDEVKQKVAELGEVKYITALDIEVCFYPISAQKKSEANPMNSTTSFSAPGTPPSLMPQSWVPRAYPKNAKARRTKTFPSRTCFPRTSP